MATATTDPAAVRDYFARAETSGDQAGQERATSVAELGEAQLLLAEADLADQIAERACAFATGARQPGPARSVGAPRLTGEPVRRRPAFATTLAALALAVGGCGVGPEPAPRPTRTVAAVPEPTRVVPPAPVLPPEHVPPDPADALARAVWVHLFDASLKTRAGIRQVVADLVAADATAVQRSSGSRGRGRRPRP